MLTLLEVKRTSGEAVGCVGPTRMARGDTRNGNRGTSAQQGFRPYSGLMLAARITLPHFSVCSTTILSSSAGEPVNAVAPSSANRAAILGLVSPALISLLSLSTTSTGVCLGAPIPTHALASKPGWNSASVGFQVMRASVLHS